MAIGAQRFRTHRGLQAGAALEGEGESLPADGFQVGCRRFAGPGRLQQVDQGLEAVHLAAGDERAEKPGPNGRIRFGPQPALEGAGRLRPARARRRHDVRSRHSHP